MGQKTVTLLTDDLDNRELQMHEGETVRFALDGVPYIIDLSSEHAEELRDAMTKYVAAGRRDTGDRVSPPRRSAKQSSERRELLAKVRTWASKLKLLGSGLLGM